MGHWDISDGRSDCSSFARVTKSAKEQATLHWLLENMLAQDKRRTLWATATYQTEVATARGFARVTKSAKEQASLNWLLENMLAHDKRRTLWATATYQTDVAIDEPSPFDRATAITPTQHRWITWQGADLSDYPLTEADRRLDSVYGDHCHLNDGTHLDGGIVPRGN